MDAATVNTLSLAFMALKFLPLPVSIAVEVFLGMQPGACKFPFDFAFKISC